MQPILSKDSASREKYQIYLSISVAIPINNIYASEELNSDSTCSILEHMGNDNMQNHLLTMSGLKTQQI